MGTMKDFDLRIRRGGDDAIVAVRELLGCPSYSDSGVAHELREYAKKLAGRGCEDIAMAAELMRFAADYIDKMPSLRTQWIAVEEQWPKHGSDVLVAYKAGQYVLLGVGEFDGTTVNDEGVTIPYFKAVHGFEVTHWMPLPEPPEVK